MKYKRDDDKTASGRAGVLDDTTRSLMSRGTLQAFETLEHRRRSYSSDARDDDKLPVAELVMILTPQQVMCKYTSTHRAIQAFSLHMGDDDK